MELRHMRLMRAVVRAGTLSGAATDLNLSQSALSHQLRELEKETQTPMFHRVNRKLVLSSAGKILLEASENILEALDQAQDRIRSEICGKQGSIRLSTYCYTCYHWLPGVLRVFEKDHAGIDIKIFPEFTKNPQPGLLDNELDLVITNIQWDDDRVAFKELFWDEQLVLVPFDHPWACKEFISPADFAEENLILYCGPVEESVLYQKVLGPHKVRPKKIIEIQLTEAAVEMIKNGMGIKVMASWAIRPYLNGQQLKAIPITKQGLYRTWYLAYLKDEGWKHFYDVFRVHLIEQMKNRTEVDSI